MLVAISSISSLTLFGTLLLAAAGTQSRWSLPRIAAVCAILIAPLLILLEEEHARKSMFTPEKELALIKRFRPVAINGGAGPWDIRFSIAYYARRAGIAVTLGKIGGPLSDEDLPLGGEPVWIFDGGRSPTATELAGTAPVLCRYELSGGTVVVVGKLREALPPAMRNC